MEALNQQILNLAKNADEAGRQAILSGLRDLSQAIETPDDTVTRIWGSYLLMASIRFGFDLKLFKRLAESSKPLSVDELASQTGAEHSLLARFLRHQASMAVIKETGRDEFAANQTTKTLASDGHEGCLKHYFDTCGPVYHEIPAYFRTHGYQNPPDANNTVFNDAWKTKEHGFEWLMKRPENFQNFNVYMASRRENQVKWIDHYPVKEDATNLSADRAIFVDVGGNIGHQCAEFKQKHPDLPGKVVLQDLPFSIENAIPTPGVENQVIDFFKDQPVKGAKFYYMRTVLHDWPDDKCRIILKNIMDAMASDSIILIDDIVTPNQGVPWQATQMDLTMMVAAASRERTEAQWQDLFDSMGLKIARRFVYTPATYEAVTAVVPK